MRVADARINMGVDHAGAASLRCGSLIQRGGVADYDARPL
jgi:hypothetical protein